MTPLVQGKILQRVVGVIYLLLAVLVTNSTARRLQLNLHGPSTTSDLNKSLSDLNTHSSHPRLRNLSVGMGCPEFLSSLYEANISDTQPFRSFTLIKGSGYGYLALHFSRLWLPMGATVILRGVEGPSRTDTFLNLSMAFPSGQLYQDVYAPPVLAKEFRIEFYREGTPILLNTHCFGFVVDSYNYLLIDDSHNIQPSREATCASDNTMEAICYFSDINTQPAYLASQAVARLTIQKGDNTAACTGWLLGSEGHLITNSHCIGNDQEASMTTVEFMADAVVCTQNCETWGACPGTVEAISTSFIYTNVALDYTLVKIQTNRDLTSLYGYLRLKATQAHVGQEVYIPQYPLHYGKRIAMEDDFGSHITILNLDVSGCETRGYSYDGDTQAGSSGSPILDALDHGVVALHHCGEFCQNTGIPSVRILQDLQQNNIVPRDAIDPGDNQNIHLFPPFQPVVKAPDKPLKSQLISNGMIYFNNVNTTIDQFVFNLSSDSQVVIDVLSAEVSDDGVYQDVNHDCMARYMDPIIFLFTMIPENNAPITVDLVKNATVATVDDAKNGEGLEDGSISSRDPYLRTFLKQGTYILAIATMPATAMDAYVGQGQPSYPPDLYTCVAPGTSGSYRIEFKAAPETMEFGRKPQEVTISGTCQVPVQSICSP